MGHNLPFIGFLLSIPVVLVILFIIKIFWNRCQQNRGQDEDKKENITNNNNLQNNVPIRPQRKNRNSVVSSENSTQKAINEN